MSALLRATEAQLSHIRKWDGPAVLLPRQRLKLATGANDKVHAMSQKIETSIAVVGIAAHAALHRSLAADVADGSQADAAAIILGVRCTPKSCRGTR
jgi:hypothetical protein